MKNSAIACTAWSLALLRGSLAAVDYSDINMYTTPFFQAFAGPPIMSARIDPVMFPGQAQSPHCHEFYGGKGLSINWKYNDAINSGCTNVPRKDDFSNYWFPALFHQSSDGTFTKVKAELRLYYHWDGQRTMFPHGLKMVAGDARSRKDEGTVFQQNLKWTCGGTTTDTMALPPDLSACGDALVTHVSMPSCMKEGTTDNFDPSEPDANMKFPTDGWQGMSCPTGYILVPRVDAEILFHGVAEMANSGSAEQAFTFAQGDSTGFGFHMDFVNGWIDGPGGLSSALNGCAEGFIAGKCVATGEQGQCNIAPTSDECTTPAKALPGCNPVYPATSGCQASGTTGGTSNGDTVSSAAAPAGTVTGRKKHRPSKHRRHYPH